MKSQSPKSLHWNKVWELWENYYIHDKLLNAIKNNSINSKDNIIIEIGCGTGADSIELSKIGFRVIVFDFSLNALKMAIELSKKYNAKVIPILGDANNLPFKNNSIHFVFHQGFLEHFSDPLPILYEQKRVIKNNGFLLVDVPQKYNLLTLRKRRAIKKGQWKYGWEIEYSINELRTLLSGMGLRISYEYGYNHPLSGTRLRNINKTGIGYFGKPVLPKIIINVIERFWEWIENKKFMLYLYESIGIITQKCE